LAEIAVAPESAATQEAERWLGAFETALANRDAAAAAALFATDSYWRDLVAFTWNLKTVAGREGVADLVEHTAGTTDAHGFRVTEPAAEADGVTEAWIAFETEVGRGSGHLRLREGKAWTLLTTLDELKGHEEPRGDDRPRGVEHGAEPDRESWLERRRREAEELGFARQPYVVIVGGGQGGIGLGARLRQLGVPTIIVDRHPRPGDQWRSRYKSLCLHDPVWYDHLPYIKFPENWPVFSPKDKIGDWLEMYTRVMELNYWGSTEAKSASWDPEAQEWTVQVEREGRAVTLRPKQLVFATGMSSRPQLPELEGMDVFGGEQHHSSQHPGPDGYRGKRVVVIGSNNSAHDICAALWEAGVDVTMVQRSPTHIVRSDTLMDIGLGALYSEQAVAAGITTEKADTIFASLPYRILHEFQIPLYDQMRERDADFYRRLEDAGFLLDWGEDGSGLFMKYLRRGSGYYIDVGASDLVADGKIKLAVGQVDRLTEDAVVLEDGTELPADLVVYATGYASMNGWVADLIDQETADRVGKVWGLGSDTAKDPGPWEGEERNMWKPTQQEALVVPRRQPASVALLLALPGPPAQGAHGGHRDTRLRPPGRPSHPLTRGLRRRPPGPRRGRPRSAARRR
jgi:putative flavoprotein involved in K+ transport